MFFINTRGFGFLFQEWFSMNKSAIMGNNLLFVSEFYEMKT